MDKFYLIDPFWTIIINYLSFQDLYVLTLVNHECYQTVKPQKILLKIINQKLKLYLGEPFNDLKEILENGKPLITGKMISDYVRKGNKFYYSTQLIFVFKKNKYANQFKKMLGDGFIEYNNYPNILVSSNKIALHKKLQIKIIVGKFVCTPILFYTESNHVSNGLAVVNYGKLI